MNPSVPEGQVLGVELDGAQGTQAIGRSGHRASRTSAGPQPLAARHLRGRRIAHHITIPPSTLITWPVM